MEQSDPLIGFGVGAMGLVRFVQAAIGALQHQIINCGWTAFDSWNDMIDVERCTLPELQQTTVPTAPTITLEYVVTQPSWNG